MMSAPGTGECLIVLVESLGQAHEDVLAQLHTRQRVKLLGRHPDWSQIHQRLEDSNRRRVPIGLWLDQDHHILAAGWAERDFLPNIMEQALHPGWARVYFATGGSHPLRTSHPD